MKTQKTETLTSKTSNQFADVTVAELDNVTGGCAACGNAACCTTGVSGVSGVSGGPSGVNTARRFGWR